MQRIANFFRSLFRKPSLLTEPPVIVDRPASIDLNAADEFEEFRLDNILRHPGGFDEVDRILLDYETKGA